MFNRLYKGIQWLLAIGVILAIFVIGAYFYNFHDGFSDSSKDWADFGSLLAGVFTFCGALATIATLLFIHKENEDNKQVIQQQAEALAFEQYLKHRELFIKMLSDIAKDCPRKIEIYNIDELYKKIFPGNKPTKRPGYSVKIKSGENCKPGDLSDIVESYNLLEEKIKYNKHECAFDLVRLMGLLHINCLEEPANGDLIFGGANQGVNIYSLQSKTDEIFRLINSLLYFTGNDDVKNINHLASSGILRETLIKHFSNKSCPKDDFYAIKKGSWIKALEEVYIQFSNNPLFKTLFKETNIRIQIGFSGRDEVTKLLHDTDGFLKCYMQEHSKAYNNRENLSEEENDCIDEAHRSIDKLNSIRQLGVSLRN